MRWSHLAKHLAMIIVIAALLAFCMIYPFLPGRYDRLAVAFSSMAQAFGGAGLVLVPIGMAWLIYERGRPTKGKRPLFALATLAASVLVVLVISLVAAVTAGLALGVVSLAVLLFVTVKIFQNSTLAKCAEIPDSSAAPLYLILLPVLVLTLQWALAVPVTEWSRNRAMAQGAQFINDIERYRAANGMYPESLAAEWPDYETGVVGIAPYSYARKGNAYNVYFEQPRFLLDQVGTTEFVVYNPRDDHTITAHANAILESTPDQPREGRGWYTSHDAGATHWKSFLFD